MSFTLRMPSAPSTALSKSSKMETCQTDREPSVSQCTAAIETQHTHGRYLVRVLQHAVAALDQQTILDVHARHDEESLGPARVPGAALDLLLEMLGHGLQLGRQPTGHRVALSPQADLSGKVRAQGVAVALDSLQHER